MAVATPAAGARETVRAKRERDQELLVWPDLVFIEFICAILFTISFVFLSAYMNAPLLNRANADITPNPSKAPWYFMNLQELLLHMDPGLAGVIVPTVLIVGLMAVPYIDRSNDGQGGWFATANAVRITVFTLVFSSFVLPWLVLWDDGAHVRVYERIPYLWGGSYEDRWTWPSNREMFFDDWGQVGNFMRVIWDFIFLENRVAIRDQWTWSLPVPFQPGSGTDGYLDWPQDFERVPVPLNGTWLLNWNDPGDSWMPAWIRIIYPYDAHLNIPAITAEYVMPIIAMIGIPAVMLLILFKIGWAKTTRDVMIALFTGFILVYVGLTIIGVAFRGKGQALVPFWKVPNLEKNPAIQRYVPQEETPRYVLIDPRTEATGRHG